MQIDFLKEFAECLQQLVVDSLLGGWVPEDVCAGSRDLFVRLC